MALSDTGGFDLALEASEELLSAALTAGPLPAPPAREIQAEDATFRVRLDPPQARSLDLLPGETVLVRGSFTGTATLLAATVGGRPQTIPPALADAVVQGTFALPNTVRIGTLSGTRGVVVQPASAGGTAEVDDDAFFASPPVQILLAAAYLLAGGGAAGQAAYQARRAAMAAALRRLAVEAVAEAAAGAPTSMIVREPAGITFGAVRTSAVSLKVLAAALLPPGDPTLATGVSLRRNALGGPLDHAALIVNNGTVLSAVRAGLSTGLGLAATFPPWLPGHPSILLSSVPIAPPGLAVPTLALPGAPPAATLFLDFAHAFVNATGLLQVDLRLRAVLWSSLATVTTVATLTAPFTGTVAAGVLTIGVAGPPTVATTTDVQISPWLYVVGVVLGAPTLIALLLTIDLLAGPALNGVITGLLGGVALPGTGLALPVTGPFAALTGIGTTGLEPGAPPRTITIPGLPVPLVMDLAQDVTARFA